MRVGKILCFILLCLWACSNTDDRTDDNEEIIEIPEPDIPEWSVNIGRDTTVPFFPDGKSNYFTYSFQREISDNFILKIDGVFPNARYLSLVLYDINTRDPIAIINDIELEPNEGDNNPFITSQYEANQKYSIVIGPDNVNLTSFENTLSYSQNFTDISIFLRYYVPEIDDFGGVPLPEFSIIDSNNNTVDPPASLDLSEEIVLGDIVADLTFLGTILFDIEDTTNERQFFRVSAANTGNFANPDNQYLISPSILSDNEVILLRWQAPLAADNFNNFENSDMRYYSMSLSNEASYNFSTFSDSELYIASDGFINVVVAKNDQEIIEQSQGLNFVEWPEDLGNEAYLLYRNLLTKVDFEYNINLCPPLSGNFIDFVEQPEAYEASGFIDAFSPQGLKMTKTEFLNDFGGITVSY